MLRLWLSAIIFAVFSPISLGQTESSDKICPAPLVVHLDLHAPSAFALESGQISGMDAELTKTILAHIGCEVSWHTRPMTGARILQRLEQGKIDVMVRASKTPDRESYAFFSRPYRSEIVGVFALKQNNLSSSLTLAEGLDKNLRLIGPASGWYGEEFERLRVKWKARDMYTAYPNAEIATKMLFAKSKRGDLVLADADIFYHYLGEERKALVNRIGPWFRLVPTHLMFSKKTVSDGLIQAVDKSIEQLCDNGTLLKIQSTFRPTEARSDGSILGKCKGQSASSSD